MKKLLFVWVGLLFAISVFSQSFPETFTNVEGYSIKGEKQFFDRDNLYDYINGASDFYLGYDFKDLWVVDYVNSNDKTATLELYHHGNEMFAFGIYSEERPQGAAVQSIGAEGFVDNGVVFFLADSYYVKVYNGNPALGDDELLEFARKIAKKICVDCDLPEQFSWFPTQDRVVSSERYMAENFMGITGFNGVATVVYQSGNEKLRMFAYKGTDEKCRQVMDSYFSRMKYKKKLKEKSYEFDDPYLGKLIIHYAEGSICGILDVKEPGQYQTLLDKLISEMK